MHIVTFTRGLGVSHTKRDLEIIKELRIKIPNVDITICSYSSGLEYLARKGYDALDLGIEATHAYWLTFARSLIKAYQLIVELKPDLLIGDEEIYVPVLGKMLGIPTCFITNWFPDQRDAIGLSCLEMADVIIFPEFQENIENLPGLTEKTKFVGPILSVSMMEEIKNMSDRRIIKRKLGYDSGQRLILVIGSTVKIDLEFMNICAKSLEIVRKKLADTVMVITPVKETDKDKVFEGVVNKEAVNVLVFIEDILTYMAASDVAVTEGGMILWELAAVGTPAISVTFSDNVEQNRLAKFMQDRGVALRIPRKEMTVESLAEKLIKILLDDTLAARMSKFGKELCSDSGARKAVEAILRLSTRSI